MLFVTPKRRQPSKRLWRADWSWKFGGGQRLGQTHSRRKRWPRLELEVEVKVGGGAEAIKASAWQGRQRSGV